MKTQTKVKPQFQTPHEAAKTTAPVVKKPKAAKPAPKASKPRKGKLGAVLGFSVVSVIRCMGKNGWQYDEAHAALVKAGIEPAKHTLKVGLKRGRDGQKRIAPLTSKQLDSLRAKPQRRSEKRQQMRPNVHFNQSTQLRGWVVL